MSTVLNERLQFVSVWRFLAHASRSAGTSLRKQWKDQAGRHLSSHNSRPVLPTCLFISTKASLLIPAAILSVRHPHYFAMSSANIHHSTSRTCHDFIPCVPPFSRNTSSRRLVASANPSVDRHGQSTRLHSSEVSREIDRRTTRAILTLSSCRSLCRWKNP